MRTPRWLTSHDKLDSARAQSCFDDSRGLERPKAMRIGTQPESIISFRDDEFDETLQSPVAHEI